RDPIGFKGGINQYVYTGNNPVNRIDPLGLLSCDGNWSMQGWDRLIMTTCVCYWLCIPCDHPVIWGGNYRSLPSTFGNLIYQGGAGLKSGDTCFCEKPGTEKDCEKCK
ncbi:MAG: RHS repeat domain-containing protein, partial [Syntrophales bacterium]